MVDVAVIQAKLVPIEQAVTNYKAFMNEGREYFTIAKSRIKSEDERRLSEESKHQRRMGWIKIAAMVVCPLLVALIIWGTVHWYTFTEDVIQMDREWRINHRTFNDYQPPHPLVPHEKTNDAGVPTDLPYYSNGGH